MRLTAILPFFLGFCAVGQGYVNRMVAKDWGLPGAVFLNSVVFLIICLILFLMSKYGAEGLPAVFKDKGSFQTFSWWYLAPGFLGFSLVAGIPYALAKEGVLKVFLGFIAAQLLVSLVVDSIAEGKAISMQRVAGAALAFAGALLVFKED